ncbi:MAG TPA: DUF362 domain-containing protein [Candidatus Pacearchaeota archaeon]|nr:DUF362 domain-containing protein [Candidatus Pacearchaeota archaeon]HPR79839.1 DUF362 domain-containing protein [Candidatus Pacearchaeota archaeon]
MVFYQCSKCKKVWQQPIEVCPECFSQTEKIKTVKAKVIGISKVSISSLPHPEVPYFALVLEDELGNKWAHKSVKEYAIGEEISFNPGSDNSVAVWRTKYDIADSIEKVFSFLNISLNKNSKIVILPALVSPNHAYFRENTSPEFLDSVIQFLLEKNIKLENIKIATQSFNEVPIEGMAQKSGLLDVCLKNKIMPLDLSKLNFVKKDNLEISEDVLNADIVLNLSMMKMGRASASENIYRILKKENFASLKYLQSEEDIVNELKNSLSNIVTLGEADFVQKQNKTIVYPGLILGSKSFLNLDRVFNEIMMADKMPEILKGIEIQNIEITGRDIKEVKCINN